jgi:Ca2+-dependent lipid-binding protein
MKTPTWNETFNYNITSVTDIVSALKVTVFHEDSKKSEELGSKAFHLPLLFNNGQGLKESFYLYSKDGRAVGKL